MIPVVLDTNVLVAALFAPDGDHARVLMELLGRLDDYEMVVSSQIVDEYEDVLSRPMITMRGLADEARALLSLVLAHAHEVVPRSLGHLVYPDIKDKPFLEAAVYVDGVLITNNLRDFPFLGVRILRAGEFLSFLRRQGSYRG